MGIFPKFIEARSGTRSTGNPGVFSDFWYGLTGGPTTSGISVSEKTAMKYIAVARCVMLISADLARLPLILYRRMSDGSKVQMVDHPLYDILKNAPNAETNSFQWRESGNGHVELWGNHYSKKIVNKYTGDIQALVQLPDPGVVTVKRNAKGVIEYRWHDKKGPHVRTRDEIFHVPGFGFNGLIGLSVINTIRESVGLGLANDEFASRYFGQGMNIGGTVTLPEGRDLGDDEDEYKARLKKEFGGLVNSHGVMVFANGETYTPFKMPLKDAQFLEGREFQAMQIFGFFGVPGHKGGIYKQNTNRNNTEQENQGYLDSCLIHRITRYETCISQQLLTKKDRQFGLFAEFNVAGLLRADSAARAEYYNKMFQIAGITPNQIAMKENMNPIGPEGDKHYVMLNMIPLDQAGAVPEPGASSIRMREHRSILARERISRQYHPLLLRAADKIVNLEATAITRNAEKFRKQRAKPDMEAWLQDFYRDVMPEKIVREMGPVFRSFSEAIQKESIAEIGADPEKVNLDSFTDDYIRAYAGRHSSSSIGQMNQQLEEDTGEGESPLVTRAGEWEERRPEKIANNETVRMANAVFQAVVFSVGLSTVWRARGAETCPYCMELNGRKVRSGQSFVADGSELNPEGGTGPMVMRGMKAHPPLHQGCDCYLSAG